MSVYLVAGTVSENYITYVGFIMPRMMAIMNSVIMIQKNYRLSAKHVSSDVSIV